MFYKSENSELQELRRHQVEVHIKYGAQSRYISMALSVQVFPSFPYLADRPLSRWHLIFDKPKKCIERALCLYVFHFTVTLHDNWSLWNYTLEQNKFNFGWLYQVRGWEKPSRLVTQSSSNLCSTPCSLNSSLKSVSEVKGRDRYTTYRALLGAKKAHGYDARNILKRPMEFDKTASTIATQTCTFGCIRDGLLTSLCWK